MADTKKWQQSMPNKIISNNIVCIAIRSVTFFYFLLLKYVLNYKGWDRIEAAMSLFCMFKF